MQTARCCIAGCGPAGAILGLLLARAGLSVIVLEKHADFLRDFRGDTLHPSTLEILDDLGLADRFLREVPHSEVSEAQFRLPDGTLVQQNFRTIPSRFKFVAFAPQWDFLEFVTREARRYPDFTLLTEAEVTDLLTDGERVVGVRYRTPTGVDEVHAELTVGCDGRTSRVREAAGLPLTETSPPMDVLWFRLSRRPTDSQSVALRLLPGHFFALINRQDYWQIAFVIAKGAYAQVRAAGLEAFRRSVAEGEPQLADRVDEIQDWEQVKLLTVRADRLRRWYRPGLLCIGDAAHAMSPIAGVGINVAIQDAVEAANLLWSPLSRGQLEVRHLARVQRRRELPVRVTQAFQNLLQERILRPTLSADAQAQMAMPGAARVGLRLPLLRNLFARFIALGLRRPHVRTPAIAAPAARSAPESAPHPPPATQLRGSS
jgi:2-polyprenyl-6-methoxyphenol hydroxylase-like FAD-dependent oxidoreductase